MFISAAPAVPPQEYSPLSLRAMEKHDLSYGFAQKCNFKREREHI